MENKINRNETRKNKDRDNQFSYQRGAIDCFLSDRGFFGRENEELTNRLYSSLSESREGGTLLRMLGDLYKKNIRRTTLALGSLGAGAVTFGLTYLGNKFFGLPEDVALATTGAGFLATFFSIIAGISCSRASIQANKILQKVVEDNPEYGQRSPCEVYRKRLNENRKMGYSQSTPLYQALEFDSIDLKGGNEK